MKITKTVKNGLNHCKLQNQFAKSWNSYYKNDIYAISNKLFNLNFFLFFLLIFTFSKQSFLGIFDFWLKTPQNYKSFSKNGQNHQFALLSFTFNKKKSTFWCWPFFSDLWHGIAHKNQECNETLIKLGALLHLWTNFDRPFGLRKLFDQWVEGLFLYTLLFHWLSFVYYLSIFFHLLLKTSS